MGGPSLNIGCGDDLHGDIRIDITPEKAGVTLVADAHNLPLRDKVVSSTVCKSVLEHLDNPLKAILEMKRVTKGTMLVTVPNILNAVRVLKTLMNPLHPVNAGTLHIQGWDLKLIKHLAHRAGLTLQSAHWLFSKVYWWSFLFHPFTASHLGVKLTDSEASEHGERCEQCGRTKMRLWCDSECTYCPECDLGFTHVAGKTSST